MPTATKRPTQARVSVRRLKAEVTRLRARVEDLEDSRALDAAVIRNAGKPGIPWAQARKLLKL